MTLKMNKNCFSVSENKVRGITVKIALIWTRSLTIRERLSFVSNSRSLIIEFMCSIKQFIASHHFLCTFLFQDNLRDRCSLIYQSLST